MTAAPRISIPVAVIMGRRMVSRSGWQVPSWRVVGVVAGEGVPGRESRAVPVHRDEDEESAFSEPAPSELLRSSSPPVLRRTVLGGALLGAAAGLALVMLTRHR